MKRRRLFLTLFVMIFLVQIVANIGVEKHYGNPFPGIFSIMYFPKGPALEFVTGGFKQFAADLLYIWAIQYYGHYEIQDRYVYLRHIFDIITELDPRYSDAYRLAALICAVEIRKIDDCALYFIERGLERNPNDWELAVDGAYYCQYYKKDLNCALKFIERARHMKNAPLFMLRWFAKIKATKGNIDESLAMWQELLEKGNSYTKNVARIHVHDLSILKQARDIKRLVNRYRELFGHWPKRLEDLRKIGYYGPLVDAEGHPFIYHPETGSVTPDERSLWAYGKIMKKFKIL